MEKLSPSPLPRRFTRTLFLAAGLWAAALSPAWAAEVQTAHLAVSDASGRLARDQLEQRAARVQALFEKVRAFWDADPGLERFGKIRVALNSPGQALQLSVFRWARDGGRMAREVLAAPSGQEPQMLAHKLASALFPSKDKLIRNMMGDVTEMRLGNPRPFPSCGLGPDAWVLALDRLGKRLPLRELGPDHAAWGMGEKNGVPFTLDPDRHHRTYAQAASFGAFLFEAYGREKLKQLCQQTGDAGRPWEAVYGAGLETLEAQWVDALRAEEGRLEPEIVLAAELYRQDPAAACGQALDRQPARQ